MLLAHITKDLNLICLESEDDVHNYILAGTSKTSFIDAPWVKQTTSSLLLGRGIKMMTNEFIGGSKRCCRVGAVLRWGQG